MAKAFKNNSNGPRTINTDMGFVTLAPGETLDGKRYKVSDADAKAVEAVGLLDAPGSNDKQGGTSSIADIQREIASAAGTTVPADMVDDKGKAKAEGEE